MLNIYAVFAIIFENIRSIWIFFLSNMNEYYWRIFGPYSQISGIRGNTNIDPSGHSVIYEILCSVLLSIST